MICKHCIDSSFRKHIFKWTETLIYNSPLEQDQSFNKSTRKTKTYFKKKHFFFLIRVYASNLHLVLPPHHTIAAILHYYSIKSTSGTKL